LLEKTKKPEILNFKCEYEEKGFVAQEEWWEGAVVSCAPPASYPRSARAFTGGPSTR